MLGKTLLVGQGTCCISSGADGVYNALKKEIALKGLEGQIEVKRPGCHGFSQIDPTIIVESDDVLYVAVREEDVPEIVQSLLPGGKEADHLFYVDPVTGKKIRYRHEVPFFIKQQRTVFKNCGVVDPESIEDYFKIGGYQALHKAVSTMTSYEVIEEIKRSGLRGLGGGGFPTGIKWEHCYRTTDEVKYVVCNADEGDPGSFQDRSLLEGDPHAVLEGLIIAGYAVGAQKGYLYVRAEYPQAIKRLQVAVTQAREKKYLGNNILGSGLNFDLEIFQGAGAFVCGEETALIASIEGGRGVPRNRPPYPAVSGLWGKPTCINNVETLANVPLILRNGAEQFATMGTEGSKGTKAFALSGKVNNTGLCEVPMGITLREIVFDIGGGIRDGKKFKAVQIGGPSGGCIPEKILDLPVDFNSLTAAGVMMGSGGLVVVDEDTCMVDLARYFLSFTKDESCGQCPPCRLGTRQMLEILKRITKGKGKESDLDLLLELAEGIKLGSLCGLGKTVPNPVLTTLRYFRDEYEAHIYEKRCPARTCKALITYSIKPDDCVACSLCLKACPVGAITGGKKQVHFIEQDKCVKCGACFDACPDRFRAVECM